VCVSVRGWCVCWCVCPCVCVLSVECCVLCLGGGGGVRVNVWSLCVLSVSVSVSVYVSIFVSVPVFVSACIYRQSEREGARERERERCMWCAQCVLWVVRVLAREGARQNRFQENLRILPIGSWVRQRRPLRLSSHCRRAKGDYGPL